MNHWTNQTYPSQTGSTQFGGRIDAMVSFLGQIARTVTVVVTLTIGPAVLADTADDPNPADLENWAVDAFGQGFAVSESEHFSIGHDGGDGLVGVILQRMELTYRRIIHFCDRYGLPRRNIPGKLKSVLVTRAGRYEQLGLPRVDGAFALYDPSDDRAYFDLSWATAAIRSDNGDAARSVFARAVNLTVQHETVHQLLDHFCPRLSGNAPEWLSEGLACLFEHEPDAGIDCYRKINVLRARDFVGFHVPSRGSCLPLNGPGKLVRRPVTDRQTERGHDSISRAGEYAVGWARSYFLMRKKPTAFGELLRRLNSLSPGSNSETVRQVVRDVDCLLEENGQRDFCSFVTRELVAAVGGSPER
jgi:Protein of unknown function (DUF1570)